MSKRSPVDQGIINIRDWRVRCFGLSYDNSPRPASVHFYERATVEAEKYFSPEFDYFRIGFAFHHFGRRGHTISLWHWGAWGDTIELFNHTIYSYHESPDSFDSLGFGEPLISYHDIPIVLQEINRFYHLIISQKTPNETRPIMFEAL